MFKSQKQKFEDQIKSLDGLKSIHFYPGECNKALPEYFYAEANRLIEAIMNDDGDPLVFNDSQKKIVEFSP